MTAKAFTAVAATTDDAAGPVGGVGFRSNDAARAGPSSQREHRERVVAGLPTAACEPALRAHRRKHEFLATLAHELRNPLSTMSNAVALLKARRTTPAVQDRAHEILGRQISRMTMLVDDLVESARTDRGVSTLHRANVHLADTVRSVLAGFEDAGRLGHLRWSTALEPVVVQGDVMRLEQVVTNLVDNAAKFTPAGGTVRVALSMDGDEARLQVADDGLGVDPAQLPHLFEPFTQAHAGTEGPRRGLGLGLSVVRSLVELHGGRVQAGSDGPGRGTCLTVWLPAPAGPMGGAVESGEPRRRRTPWTSSR